MRLPHFERETLIERAFDGVPQYFHDLGDNDDINNLNEVWAHAAPLVQYLNRVCRERVRG